MGHDARKPVFDGLRTKKAQTGQASAQSDQRLWYLLIGNSKLATSENSLVFVTEQAGFSMT